MVLSSTLALQGGSRATKCSKGKYANPPGLVVLFLKSNSSKRHMPDKELERDPHTSSTDHHNPKVMLKGLMQLASHIFRISEGWRSNAYINIIAFLQ